MIVDGKNTSALDATVRTTGETGGESLALTLAINTLGWKSQNVLLNTIEAVIGDPAISESAVFGGDDSPAATRAYILNSPIDAAGNLTVSADNAASLNATVSNNADSFSSALYDAEGKAIGGAVLMNKVNSAAEAYIDNASAPPLPGTDLDTRAGGTLTVFAADNSENYANIKIISSSVTSSDGGVAVVNETARDFLYADFSSTETNADVGYFQRVRLADDYANGGKPGSVYEWLGTDEAGQGLNLSEQDYSDAGYWKEVPETTLFPEGINFDDAGSKAFGGAVVLNDLRSAVEAYIVNAEVEAEAVDIDALEQATIRATTETNVVSSGGSAFSGGGDSLAINGAIATNVVLSSAEAYIDDSTITTTAGDVDVHGENTSTVDAKTLNNTSTGAQGVGVTLAFNTLGWKSQNVLFNAVDVILGDPLISGAFGGNETPASVKAYIQDSDVDSAGAIRVTAVSDATLNATVTNETESAAYSFATEGDGASGFAVGVVLAHNMVNSEAQAFIGTSDPATVAENDRQTVNARGGGVYVHSQDDSNIDANTRLAAISSSTNDQGLSLVTQLADDVVGEYWYTDRSGVRDLQFFDQVRLDDVDYTTNDANVTEIVAGDRVEILDDLSNGSASEGQVYEYTGTTSLTDAFGLNLRQLTYSGGPWKLVKGTPGSVYRFLPDSDEGVDLANEDFTNTSRWQDVTASDVGSILGSIPGFGYNVTDSKSSAFGGLIVRNDVRSDVLANINNGNVDAAGDVSVKALERAEIFADDDSTVTSSGGGTFGGGSSTAVNGVISTNLLLSGANASVTNSSVDATGGGQFILDGQNTSTLDASVSSIISSNGNSIGGVLAFNTIGIASQNLLFNTVDTILGTNIADEDPAQVQAFTDNTTINVQGGISATALLDATLTANINNSATTIAASFAGNDAITVGPVVALNKMSTDVEASLDDASVVQTSSGDITVIADDSVDRGRRSRRQFSGSCRGGGEFQGDRHRHQHRANEIHDDVQAFIRNAGSATQPVKASGGDLRVAASQDATINATSRATAIAVAASQAERSKAVAGVAGQRG